MDPLQVARHDANNLGSSPVNRTWTRPPSSWTSSSTARTTPCPLSSGHRRSPWSSTTSTKRQNQGFILGDVFVSLYMCKHVYYYYYFNNLFFFVMHKT